MRLWQSIFKRVKTMVRGSWSATCCLRGKPGGKLFMHGQCHVRPSCCTSPGEGPINQQGDRKWIGPAKVVQQDPQRVVFTSYMGNLFRSAPEHCRPASAIEARLIPPDELVRANSMPEVPPVTHGNIPKMYQYPPTAMMMNCFAIF